MTGRDLSLFKVEAQKLFAEQTWHGFVDRCRAYPRRPLLWWASKRFTKQAEPEREEVPEVQAAPEEVPQQMSVAGDGLPIPLPVDDDGERPEPF